jgi:spectinomycin phosphotransferase
VREPPPGVTGPDVLAAVRAHWDDAVRGAEHLPVGFGAHHWAAHDDQGPRLFVTLDRLERKRTADRLEAAYAGAAALREAGLEFVLAPLASSRGTFTVPLGDGALSCTPWREGRAGGQLDVPWTADALRRLHAVDPPAGIPEWRPLVGPDLADRLASLGRRAWGPGPYAERARAEVLRHLAGLETWTARYHRLADVARGHPWVATHGEPHEDNQLLTPDGRLLVDWESLKLAPRELDLRTLADAGLATDADPEMLELFDLEWRLDEVDQYAAWFSAPHTGTADDHLAFDGLLHELTRE